MTRITKPPVRSKRVAKEKPWTPIEEAILWLADYLEDPNHSDYRVVEHIAGVLRPAPRKKN